MAYITMDPTDALSWWEVHHEHTILTNGERYCIGRDLTPFGDWRIFSPEELEVVIKEQA